MHLPDHSSIDALVNTFRAFFNIKSLILRSSIHSGSCSNVLNPRDARKVMLNQSCVPDDEMHRRILLTPSLPEGSFPSHFEFAIFSLLLKKLTLNNMKNHLPESNLSFLIKVLEEVVASPLKSSNILNYYQSAYGKFNFAETALLKIHNDILSSMDGGKVTDLTLLKLSGAFHTIVHTILLNRLDEWSGVTRKALD